LCPAPCTPRISISAFVCPRVWKVSPEYPGKLAVFCRVKLQALFWQLHIVVIRIWSPRWKTQALICEPYKVQYNPENVVWPNYIRPTHVLVGHNRTLIIYRTQERHLYIVIDCQSQPHLPNKHALNDCFVFFWQQLFLWIQRKKCLSGEETFVWKRIRPKSNPN
jgi:hypothetical protein